MRPMVICCASHHPSNALQLAAIMGARATLTVDRSCSIIFHVRRTSAIIWASIACVAMDLHWFSKGTAIAATCGKRPNPAEDELVVASEATLEAIGAVTWERSKAPAVLIARRGAIRLMVISGIRWRGVAHLPEVLSLSGGKREQRVG